MKTISRARNLKNHMLTHSENVGNGDNFFLMEKTSFKCSLCPSKFSRRDSLMRHVNSHHKITEDIGENANIIFYKENFISRVIPEETNETINFNKSNFLSRVIPEEKMKLLLISLKQK